jgi:hypothetical protein
MPIIAVGIIARGVEAIIRRQWQSGVSADVIVIILAGLFLVTIVSYGIRALMCLPFGIPVRLCAPLLDFSVEAAPHGEWTILQLPPLQARGLRHGVTHEHPQVAVHVARWLLLIAKSQSTVFVAQNNRSASSPFSLE